MTQMSTSKARARPSQDPDVLRQYIVLAHVPQVHGPSVAAIKASGVHYLYLHLIFSSPLLIFSLSKKHSLCCRTDLQ